MIAAGYGHIAPKTATGRLATIIYATFGIPLTLLTIAQVGGYMAAVFRFTYKNLVCGLGAGACTCCRRTTQQHVSRDATGQTTLEPDQPDDDPCSPTHNRLLVEGHDLGQGQFQGHSDECNDATDGEAIELTIVKGKQTCWHNYAAALRVFFFRPSVCLLSCKVKVKSAVPLRSVGGVLISLSKPLSP